MCPTAAAIHNSHGRCEERVARQAAEQLLPMVEVLLQPGLPGRITLAALAALQALFTRVGEQPELFTDVFALLNDPRILSAIIARIEGKATSDSGLDGVQSNWSPHWADSQLLSRVVLDTGAPASLHDASTIGQEAIYALSCIVHPSPPPPSLFSFCLDPKVIISRIKIHIPYSLLQVSTPRLLPVPATRFPGKSFTAMPIPAQVPSALQAPRLGVCGLVG